MAQTNSQLTLNALQKQFGSTNYDSWQSLRKRWYSFITYPEAGSSVLTFFGSALGQGSVTREQTNIPKAGSFGQNHFLLKSIACVVKIQTWDLEAWSGLDASTLFSDFFNGFVQAGVLEVKINARPFVQVVKPFLYCPPFDGREQVYSAGLDTLTLTEGTPNVIATYRSAAPYATQTRTIDGIYQVDPNILIEAEQNFECTISFPSGLVPVIGTSVTDDTSNPLKVGVIFDGILMRPVQ